MSALAVSLGRGPLIGVCLGSCLYGITCLQALFYFQTYVDDRRSLKLTVALLLTLETIHVALSMWLVDYYLVANYANETALQSATPHIVPEFVQLPFVVHYRLSRLPECNSYFTWRIWNFTGKLWVVVFMIVVALARASGFTSSLLRPSLPSALSSTWVTYLERDRGLILTGIALFVFGDTFSASIMAWHLNKSRDDTLRLVNTLAFVFMLIQPVGLAFTGLMFVHTRLYSNSLLASLNLRNVHMHVYENALYGTVELPTRSMVFAPPPCERSNHEEIGSLSGVVCVRIGSSLLPLKLLRLRARSRQLGIRKSFPITIPP
ncbi:hypothetical protein BKA83DRAFT_4606949 [Pisolithus microcarpus]|nr:hypothetical protein BKA83DRAFT_4606949 [Pisolithus microcarpus]